MNLEQALSKIKELESENSSLLRSQVQQEKRLAAIERENLEGREATKAAQLKALAIAEISKPDYGAISPQQLLKLIGSEIRLNESGKAVGGDLELPLGEYIRSLRRKPEYQNQFRASGATGSGSSPATGSSGAAVVNPWKKETRNLTEQGRIFKENPVLAEKLKAAASK